MERARFFTNSLDFPLNVFFFFCFSFIFLCLSFHIHTTSMHCLVFFSLALELSICFKFYRFSPIQCVFFNVRFVRNVNKLECTRVRSNGKKKKKVSNVSCCICTVCDTIERFFFLSFFYVDCFKPLMY